MLLAKLFQVNNKCNLSFDSLEAVKMWTFFPELMAFFVHKLRGLIFLQLQSIANLGEYIYIFDLDSFTRTRNKKS